ncbi:MAG: MFS transporter, partial [Trueperaceae bacterium]
MAAAAWLNALMGAGFLQVFGVYVVALQDAFGWQASALAASFALQRASTAVASPLVGAWLRRFGPRRVALAGVAAFALGTAILGSVRSLAALFAVMPLLGLATTAMGPLTHTSALVNRFTRRRATAVAWTLTGVGLGGLLVPGVALLLMSEGMQVALLIVGAVALLTGVPAALALGGAVREGDATAAPASPPTGASHAAAPAGQGAEHAGRGDVATSRRRLPWPSGSGRAFWTLGIGHLLAAAVIGSLTVHLVPFLRLAHGLPLARASVLVGVLAVASIAAQVLGAPAADRLGHRRAAVTGAILEALGLTGLVLTFDASWAAAWIALIGL